MNFASNTVLYVGLTILVLLVLRAMFLALRNAIGMKVTCYQVGKTKVTRCELGSMKLVIEDKRA